MDEHSEDRRARRRRAGGLTIGRVAGAPIVLDLWWPLGALALAAIYVPTASRVARPLTELAATGMPLGLVVALMTVAFAVLLLGSVALHEVAHALTARAYGRTVRSVTLTAWGGQTAYDARGATPRSHLLTAVAGPAVNVALVAILGVPALVLGAGEPSTGTLITQQVLLAGAIANGVVAVVNLVPALPYDGGAILEALVWRLTRDRAVAGRIAAASGYGVALALVVVLVAWWLYASTPPPPLVVAWSLVLAVLVWHGASRATAVAVPTARAVVLDPARLVRPATVLAPEATIDDALSTLLADGVRAVIVPDALGRPRAWADGAALAAVPAERRSEPVLAVATALAPAQPVDSSLTGLELFAAVRAASQAPVIVAERHGRVVGIIVVADVVDALRAPSWRTPRRDSSQEN
ncbi:site-2 protease family protein [Sanguibacter sp. A247]|uniref:site-2 protease family protein n=1 Tax=unclassified Sanguibacter TaxID=2645534 RepID=UPI003FD72A43